MNEERMMRDVTADEVQAHFDAVDEAARLRQQLARMRQRMIGMAQEIARRDAELDVDIEIVHSDFDEHGEIVYEGAIIGR